MPPQLPRFLPMPLGRGREPFDGGGYVYELKYDGFRALACIEDGACRLVSRNGNVFRSFTPLAELIAESLRLPSAIVDGEIVCLDSSGKPRFRSLLLREQLPCFAAFDLLWLDGRDLRPEPLLERKRLLRRIVRPRGPLLYVDHCSDGVGLFRLACEQDLEGIVAKDSGAAYVSQRERTTWWKIKNTAYSQAEGRHELLQRRRTSETAILPGSPQSP